MTIRDDYDRAIKRVEKELTGTLSPPAKQRLREILGEFAKSVKDYDPK